MLLHMPLVPASEPRILHLYYNVVALAQGSRTTAFQELKTAVLKHVERARTKTAKLTLSVAVRNEFRA